MGVTDESLVLRAALRDELSGPIKSLRADIASLTAAVKESGDETEKTGRKTDEYGTGADNAKKSTEGLTDALKGIGAAGAVITAGFAGAAVIIANFESGMSELKVASGATNDELDRMRAAAIEAGKSGIFTETQATEGMTALAKAGISVSDILAGGLTGALNLAAAGDLELGAAAEDTASALSQFGLAGNQASHVADLLAAGAGKAQGSVTDMAESLKYTGLIAHQTGVPIEQTVGALAMFAQKGLIGSQAGTSFAQMLMRMNPTMGQSRDLITKLGLSAYDSSGKFIGLANYAQLLKDKLGRMSAEQRQATLSQIFGQQAVQTATILYEGGKKGVDDWTKAVSDSGYASRYASGRLDNLNGDVLKLKGTLQALVTGAGSGTNDMLRSMTQHLTNDVELFGSMPRRLQSTALQFAGVAGAGMAAVGMLGVILPKFTELQNKLMLGGTGSQALARGVGMARTGFLVAIPVIALAAVALDYFGQRAAARKKDIGNLADAITQDGNAIGDTTRKMIAKTLVDDKAISNAQKLGISSASVTAAVIGQGKAYAELKTRLDRTIDAGTTYTNTVGGYGMASGGTTKKLNEQAVAAANLKLAMEQESGKLKEAQRDAANMAAALDATSTVNQKVAASTGQSTDEMYRQQLVMQDATDSASALKNMLDGLNNTNLDLADSEVNYHQALLAIKTTIDSNIASKTAHARSLSLDTAAGLQNRSNIDQAVHQAMTMAEAVTKQTGSIELGSQKFGEYRAAIRKAALDSHLSKKDVDALLSSIAQLPTLSPKVPVHANTKPAATEIQHFTMLQSTQVGGPRLPLHVDTAPAKSQIASLKATLISDPLWLNVQINRIIGGAGLSVPAPAATANSKTLGPLASLGNSALPGLGGTPLNAGRAFGGPLVGPGSSRSDSLSMVSNREWVMPWTTRERYGDKMMAQLQHGTFPTPALPQPANRPTGLAAGIFVAAGAVQVTVQSVGSPADVERADIPGQVAAGMERWHREQRERS